LQCCHWLRFDAVVAAALQAKPTTTIAAVISKPVARLRAVNVLLLALLLHYSSCSLATMAARLLPWQRFLLPLHLKSQLTSKALARCPPLQRGRRHQLFGATLKQQPSPPCYYQ